MSDNLIYLVRGSTGFSVRRGIVAGQTIFNTNGNYKESPCRIAAFSNTGDYLCFCDTKKTTVIECATGRTLFSVDLPRTAFVHFSPKDKILCTYEPYVVYGSTKDGETRTPQPNLRLFSLPDGQLLCTLIAHKQHDWHPQWTDDELQCARLVGSELLFHKGSNYEKYDSKLVIPKMTDYALSPGAAPYHVACYVPPAKGQPAVVHLRHVDGGAFATISNKTVWKCDRVSLQWNPKGNALIVLAIVDVDASNKSYYGEQNLFLLLTNSESSSVPLAKKGPIYSVKWNPNSREFAVCYGFMPAKVTLYNLKGEATFDFDSGPRNDIHYNRFGTILLICGFGNLSAGNMEFWSLEDRREIIKIQVPNTTLFEWAPDGQHFLTATTTPRLRIDNCYRIWHYTGRLISESLCAPNEELWQAHWRPIADGVYNRFPVEKLTSQQIAQSGLMVKAKKNFGDDVIDSLPAGAISQSGAYVPPHLRKATAPSKGALSNGVAVQRMSALSDHDKALRTLQKKLKDISALKVRLEKGEKLEANQLAKIDKETELIEELAKLQL